MSLPVITGSLGAEMGVLLSLQASDDCQRVEFQPTMLFLQDFSCDFIK